MANPTKILKTIRDYKTKLGKIIDTDDEFESLHEDIINLLKAIKRNKGEYKEFVEYPPVTTKLWFEKSNESINRRRKQLIQFKQGILSLLKKLEREYSVQVDLQ